jgi:hypothetical protein
MEFTGCDAAVRQACRELDGGRVRWMRHQHGGAYLVRDDLGNEVEALLTSRGYVVQAGF